MKEEIKKTLDEFSNKYMLLDRMRLDCEYYLAGHRSASCLWAENEREHIEAMKYLYNSFQDKGKPQWLTMEDIEEFEKQMIA